MKITHEEERESKQITFGDLKQGYVFGYECEIYIKRNESHYSNAINMKNFFTPTFYTGREVIYYPDAELKLGRGVDNV